MYFQHLTREFKKYNKKETDRPCGSNLVKHVKTHFSFLSLADVLKYNKLSNCIHKAVSTFVKITARLSINGRLLQRSTKVLQRGCAMSTPLYISDVWVTLRKKYALSPAAT